MTKQMSIPQSRASSVYANQDAAFDKQQHCLRLRHFGESFESLKTIVRRHDLYPCTTPSVRQLTGLIFQDGEQDHSSSCEVRSPVGNAYCSPPFADPCAFGFGISAKRLS